MKKLPHRTSRHTTTPCAVHMACACNIWRQPSTRIKLVCLLWRAFSKRSIESIACNCIPVALLLQALNMRVRVRAALSIGSNHRRRAEFECGARALQRFGIFLFRGFKCCKRHILTPFDALQFKMLHIAPQAAGCAGHMHRNADWWRLHDHVIAFWRENL